MKNKNQNMKTNLSFQKNATTNLLWRTFALNMLICLVFSVSKLVAQSFNPLQTNPFGLATDYDIKAPCLVDIDNDGDQDLFAISQYGAILYYWENIGTASAPAYGSMQQNPFGIMMGGD